MRTLSPLAMLILVTAVAGSGSAAKAQRTIYVSAQAAGAGDGSSWTDAFVFLQDALADVRAGEHVWVAAGVYRPDQGAGYNLGDRSASFVMPAEAKIFGGFKGTEESVSERTNSVETVLSGDLLGNDVGFPSYTNQSKQDNSYRIATLSEVGETAVLDGFTISGSFGGPRGGGMFVGGPATVRNVLITGNHALEGGGALAVSGLPKFLSCTFSNNVAHGRGGALYVRSIRMDSSVVVENLARQGGGMYVVGGEDSGAITNTVFLRNVAEGDGGAVVNRWEAPPYINVRFIGNSADGGGAVSNDDAQASFVNVEFIENSATSFQEWGEGGAMTNHTSSVSVVNATFSGNSSLLPGAAIWNWYSETDVVNSIFWRSAGTVQQEVVDWGVDSRLTLWSSIYEGSLDSSVEVTGPVLDSDPRFLDPSGPDGVPGTLDDNFSLSPASPAIDAGDGASMPADIADLDGDGDRSEIVPFDLGGNARVQGGRVDLGAYESPGSTFIGPAPPEVVADRECDLGIFPSPFGSEVVLTVESQRAAQLKVFDIAGRKLYERSLGPGATPVDTSTWPSGVYLFTKTTTRGWCKRSAIKY